MVRASRATARRMGSHRSPRARGWLTTECHTAAASTAPSEKSTLAGVGQMASRPPHNFWSWAWLNSGSVYSCSQRCNSSRNNSTLLCVAKTWLRLRARSERISSQFRDAVRAEGMILEQVPRQGVGCGHGDHPQRPLLDLPQPGIEEGVPQPGDEPPGRGEPAQLHPGQVNVPGRQPDGAVRRTRNRISLPLAK